MEPIADEQANRSPSRNQIVEDEEAAANDLLEDCWFFDNLLNRKQRTMSGCFSDPQCNSSSSSSNFGQETSVKNSTGHGKSNSGVRGPNLVRTPSLPLHIGRQEEGQEKQDGGKSMSKLTRQPSHQKMLQTPPSQPPACPGGSKTNGQSVRHSLVRTPSLPPCIGRKEKNQENVPHKHKGIMTQSCTIPRYRAPKNTEGESNASSDGGKEMTRRGLMNRLTTRKSLSDLEIEEVQGFKDLGFTFDKQELSPSVLNILPGLQEKKGNEEYLNPESVRRPYLSEAWMVQSFAPPPPPRPPNLVASRSAEDMKEQIKFWARAVASNVR